MKVMFAIRDENNIVGSIVRKYQQDYKEKLIYKEVKNFTAIFKELQQNNDYDRIIISDDIDTKINQSENRLKLILNNLNKINKLTTSENKISPIIVIGNTAYIDQLIIIFSYLNISTHISIVKRIIDINENATENLLNKLYLFLLNTNAQSTI